jgi:hypothetical protein
MAYFAKVNRNGEVINIRAVESDFFDTFVDNSPGIWIETFKDRSSRKNFAGIGFTYDEDRDAFVPPKPFDSWVLDEDTCQWEAPLAEPTDGGRYEWNEETQTWDEVE